MLTYYIHYIVCDGAMLCDQGEDEDIDLCQKRGTFPKEASLREFFMLTKHFPMSQWLLLENFVQQVFETNLNLVQTSNKSKKLKGLFLCQF